MEKFKKYCLKWLLDIYKVIGCVALLTVLIEFCFHVHWLSILTTGGLWLITYVLYFLRKNVKKQSSENLLEESE